MSNKRITVFRGDVVVDAGEDTAVYGSGDLEVANNLNVVGTITAGSGLGEANTASNVGTSGTGILKQKNGVDFQFKKINPASTKITITDDTINNKIDINVDPTQITHTDLQDVGSNTHAQIDSHIANTSNPHVVTIDQITPSSAKGDLLVEDGSNVVRLPVGTDGQLLAASSVTATGLVWQGEKTPGNIGTGTGIFKGLSGTTNEFKSIVGGSNLGVVENTNDITLNLDTDPVISGSLIVDNLKCDGNTISSTDSGGNINILPNGSGQVLLKSDPTSNLGAATKQYVDSVATGLDFKQSTRVKTDTALTAYTQSGLGSSAKLTADANGAIGSIDGVTLVLNDRVLVDSKGSSNDSDNGIYTLTQVGDGSNPWILTRASDANSSSEVTSGMFLFIEEGTVYANTGWVLSTSGIIVLDTTSLEFTQFSGSGAGSASNVGSSGVGLFKQLNGTILEFKNIAAGSNKLSVTDDAGNDEIDLDIVPGNINHQDLSGAGTNTHAQIDTHLADTTLHFTQGNITTVGVLDSGSISSGFGNIDVGSSTISSGQITVGNIALNTSNGLTYSGASGANKLTVPDNLSDAFSIQEGSNKILSVDTTNGTEHIDLLKNTHVTGNLTVSGTIAGRNVATDGSVLDSHIGNSNNPHSVTIDQITPTTTKGDLLVDSGNGMARLAAGSTGQVLVADAAQTTGMKWATASSSSGGEINTASNYNSGSGIGWFKGKTNEDLEFWKLNNGRGTKARYGGNMRNCYTFENNFDDSCSSLNGTVTGGVTFGPGKLGSAAVFDGLTNSRVNLGTLDVPNSAAFSITCWFKANSFGDMRLVSKANGSNTGDHIFAAMLTSNTNLAFRLTTGEIGTGTQLNATVSMQADTWYFGCWRYDGSTYKIFLDCVEVGSAAKTGYVPASDSIETAIGNQPNNGGGNRPFSGSIDQVVFWNKALTTAELNSLYNGGDGRYPNGEDRKWVQVDIDTQLVILKDVKPKGTNGGTFYDGYDNDSDDEESDEPWKTRVLNTMHGNGSSWVTLVNNTFTLAPGNYYLTANAPAHSVNDHQARLYNITHDSVHPGGYGTVSRARWSTTDSEIKAFISIFRPETFKIQHRCESTDHNDGFGRAGGWGDETYTQVTLFKMN